MDKRKNLFQRMKQTIKYKKNNVKIKTTQETLNFDKVFSNGIIKLNNNTYSKSLRFSDVGYQLAKDEDKTRVFTLYCSLLNWFDPEINFQFSFINYKIEQEAYKDKSIIDTKNTRLKQLQSEYNNVDFKIHDIKTLENRLVEIIPKFVIDEILVRMENDLY